MFYDMGVRALDDEIAAFAKTLGWDGICLIIKQNQLKEFKRKKYKGMDIAYGIEIQPKRPDSIKKEVLKVRKSFELVCIRGGDLEINRKALETPEVDVLIEPWGSLQELRSDPGINHISARIGKENNVSICFDFSCLTHSYHRKRSEVFQNYLKAARLLKKYKTPFIITSGSLSKWDLRPPLEMMSFGRALKLGDKEIKNALSPNILKENRKRIGGKWIMPGVEKV